MQISERARILTAEEGQAIWFAGALMVRKIGGEESEGKLAVFDQRVPAHYATPFHVHHDEDEAWYILEGNVSFRFGDERFSAGPGTWVYLPKDVPHGFRTEDHEARLLTFAAPAGFGHFVQESGVQAAGATLPPPAPLDIAKLMEVAAKYRIEMVGSPEEI
jgi:mannose-6-phosphate isomerase-like protein (cupin superfamily)